MTRPLQGKTALITGASRGIGRAIALRLAELGANIAINYARNQEACLEAQQAIEKHGVKTFTCQGNIGDPKIIAEFVEGSIQALGGIDLLIHNAAIGAFKPVHKLRPNQWDLSMDVNAKAFLLLVQKALPAMEAAGGGGIIALSSLGSRKFIPDYGAIGISKAALENTVRYLAVELASKNIRVNGVSGGLVDTDALKAFPKYEELRAEVERMTPAGRIGEADDLARVVAFLALPASSWIVGQILIADGGLSLL